MDVDGTILEFNPAAEKTFGYSREEALGKKVEDLLVPVGHRDAHRRGLARYVATGLSDVVGRRIEIDAMRSDGSQFPVQLAITRTGLGAGSVFTAVIRDLSEERAKHAELLTRQQGMENELRESAELFERAFSAAQTGIALIAADSRKYIDVNEALCEMLGYSKDELMTLDWLDLTLPQDREKSLRTLHEFVAGTQKLNYLMKRYVKKDGNIISVEISEAVVRDPEGRPLYFVSHITDITERQRAALALKESEELLQAVIENSPAIIYIKDSDGRYLMANKRFLNAFEMVRDRVLGRTDYDLFPAEVADVVAATDRKVLDSGPMRIEENLPHIDGSLHSYISVKFPLKREGQELQLCGISTDITDRVDANDEKKRLEAQLRQAQKMEAVGQLAGGVAHDFNNILSVILNYAQFVADDLPKEDARRPDVEEIIAAGQRAAQLVHQLLAFSRKEIVEPRVVDLSTVVRGVQGLLQRSIREDICLEVATAHDLWLTKSDIGQLEQILMNLVVNARDAMPQGGHLLIATSNETLRQGERHGLQPGRYACMKVSDDGAGMDAATVDRIFEPFFTTKDRGKGTGLGLATVYGIVKQAGGGIYVDSDPGQGTTFSVYLPTTDELSGTFGPNAFEGEDPMETGTILVVEDEVGVRNLVSRILISNGFEVVAVSSGAAALEYCSSHAVVIDLLLTDVVMPEMSGKVLAGLFDLERKVRVLYMSGYTDEIIAKRGVLGGDEDLIEKPFTAQALVAKVRAALREQVA
jgi:PAS domain S-box-containing protein